MNNDTIAALATPAGPGAIGVLRLSGPRAIEVVAACFKGKNLLEQPSHTVHFGSIRAHDGALLDEVLVSLFRTPRSYTREDVAEVSCHGSPFVLQRVLERFLQLGARLADPGEFTLRAFLNGQLDLAQAEAVADLIAAENAAQHDLALRQLRGGVSNDLQALRQQLIDFAALIELELDFGEEDVTFADRSQLESTVRLIQQRLDALIGTFRYGNALKNGVPVVIAGKPNAGKSTLLNALLNEEKAIVSDIAGTTRDFIEDVIAIEGVAFRFTDTAGLRETTDPIEQIGVRRAGEKIRQSALLLYLVDLAAVSTLDEFEEEKKAAQAFGVPFLIVANKRDAADPSLLTALAAQPEVVCLSARLLEGLDTLKEAMFERLGLREALAAQATVLTSARHVEALAAARAALDRVLEGLATGISGDFLAMDIRLALRDLGSVTGAVDVDKDILGSIFGKFCIGK